MAAAHPHSAAADAVAEPRPTQALTVRIVQRLFGHESQKVHSRACLLTLAAPQLPPLAAEPSTSDSEPLVKAETAVAPDGSTAIVSEPQPARTLSAQHADNSKLCPVYAWCGDERNNETRCWPLGSMMSMDNRGAQSPLAALPSAVLDIRSCKHADVLCLLCASEARFFRCKAMPGDANTS
jgi:hypothetical protein